MEYYRRECYGHVDYLRYNAEGRELLVVFHEQHQGKVDDIGVMRYQGNPAPDFDRQNVVCISEESFQAVYDDVLRHLRSWSGTP
ncbi:hypothetical protein [Paraburkholderia sp. J12]|uniref:hypothetical protein n=1 Tax=Paraburkholderia sp. J12 TaxID=2805432 RepID=UPI002ABD4499|nr:hypothetical protein [Paraburkholderia sp. J12]